VEEGNQRRDADERLTPEGKDRQSGDTVGVKVKHRNLIVLQGGGEERGERRDQPGRDAMKDEGVHHGRKTAEAHGGRPHLSGAPLVGCRSTD
jgi:hypothetical protein